MRTVPSTNRDRACRITVRHRSLLRGITLVVLAVAATAAAQQPKSDRDLLTHQTCTGLSSEDCSRLGRLKEGEARHQANKEARRNELLRLPPLPHERNVLLGSWRLEDAGQGGGDTGFGQRKGTGGTDAMFRELWATLESNPDKLFCNPMMFGHGITFAPSTYSIQALDGSVSRSSIAYRSTEKQVVVAIPGNMEMDLPFQIAGPNRILFRGSCALVRFGAPAANAAASTTPAPINARTAAASPPAPPSAGTAPQVAAAAPAPQRSTLSRPSPEVCRNTLLDQLGVAGINQVRAMSDVRFKEAAIDGKVPNTNNPRIDLRGSACDDPRIKATLYDFDANGMLQSITYVWDRPPGPAPAPIFSERVSTLSRFHPSLPQPQTTGRLQGDTSLGRLIVQDMPERNVLLEAYTTKK